MSAASWESFTSLLGELLWMLGGDESVVVSLGCDEDDPDDTPRYVQFCAHGPGWARAEVVGNTYLQGSRRLTPEQESALISGGWTPPRDSRGHGSPNFHLDVEQEWADFAVDAAVRAFREVWAVAEPEELVVDHPFGRFDAAQPARCAESRPIAPLG